MAPAALLLKQFTDPLVLILLFAGALSAFLHEWLDAAIVLTIVLGSGGLGFVQEYRASRRGGGPASAGCQQGDGAARRHARQPAQ